MTPFFCIVNSVVLKDISIYWLVVVIIFSLLSSLIKTANSLIELSPLKRKISPYNIFFFMCSVEGTVARGFSHLTLLVHWHSTNNLFWMPKLCLSIKNWSHRCFELLLMSLAIFCFFFIIPVVKLVTTIFTG